MKKPAELDSAKLDIKNKYIAQQEYSLTPPPLASILSNINPNPKNTKISKILNKFKSLISIIWSNEIEVKKIEDSLVVEDIDKIVDESIQSKKSDIKLDKLNLGDDYEGLFSHFNKEDINYLYSLFFRSENIPERPNKAYSKLILNLNLLAEAREFLKSTSYNDVDIIVNDIINPEVLQTLGDKFNIGIEFSKLERIIADVAILSGDGSKYVGSSINNEISYGMVNSESRSIENSFEKTERNVERLGIARTLGFSMLGKLKHGAKVPFEIHKPGNKYEIGNIIVFTTTDGVNIIHEIVGYKDSNGQRTYTTKGVNNQEIDGSPVSDSQIIGLIVELSKSELKALQEMADNGKAPYIKALTSYNYADSEKARSIFKKEFTKLREEIGKLDKSYKDALLNNDLKDNLFDTLLEYSAKDLEYKDYAERTDILTHWYNKAWKNDHNAKRVQRLLWGILTDFRHPLTGEKIEIEKWLSLSLHHWRTEGGQTYNKYDCTFLSLIPLPRGGNKGHSQITAQIRNDKSKGLTWENTIKDAIEKILDGEAPKGWDNNYKESFKDYADSIRNTREMIKNFLKYNQDL